MNNIDWDKPQRQSPIVLLIIFLESIKQLWPFLLLMAIRFLFKSEDDNPEKNDLKLLWTLLGALILILLIRLKQVVHYFSFYFQIKNNLLLVRSGVFTKVKTEIPFSKIQSIHQNQHFLHRLSNTCELSISTSGSSKEEIKIKGISLTKATELKRLLSSSQVVTEDHVKPESMHAAPEKKISLTARDLFKLCLSENHFKTLLIILAFLLARFQDLEEYLDFDSVGWLKQQGDFLQTTSIVAVLIILALFVSIIVSSIRVLLRYFNFNILLQKNQFVISHGLVETKEKKIRFSRVKLLSWHANFVRRKLGLSILRVWVMSEDNNEKNKSANNIPITRLEQLQQINSWYQPQLPSSVSSAFQIDPSYTTRTTLISGIIPAVVVGCVLFPFIHWNALWVIVWAVYAGIHNHLFRKNFKVWIHEDAIEIEKTVWGQEHFLLNLKDVESVAVTTSVYQRKHGVANLKINTSAQQLSIPFLQADLAAFLADFILYRIEFASLATETIASPESSESY